MRRSAGIAISALFILVGPAFAAPLEPTRTDDWGEFTGPAVVDGGIIGCTFTGTSTPDAIVGAFGNHGGPTKTIPVLPGSPAIDRARSASCPSLDQRGKKRPSDIDLCDFGAFERKLSDE